MNLAGWLATKTPAATAKATGAGTQRKMSRSMKPASPQMKEKRVAATKKRVVESDDEGDGDSDVGDFVTKLPTRKTAPVRKAVVSRSKYIELSSEDEGEDDSVFVDNESS